MLFSSSCTPSVMHSKSFIVFSAILAQQADCEGPKMEPIVGKVYPADAPIPFNSGGIFVEGYTENGRVVESYSTEIAEELGPGVIARLERQVKMDARHDEYPPITEGGLGVQPTVLGNLTIGPLIHRGFYTTIFEIVDKPDYLIKYQSDCLEINENQQFGHPYVHPLLREFWFSDAAGAHDLSVDIFTVSPPASLCTKREGVCDFNPMDPDDEMFNDCRVYDGTIRYIVMRKSLGKTLRDEKERFVWGIVHPAIAFQRGIELMEVLRILHTEAGVVHGDIHMENVLLETDPDDPYKIKLRLIDFWSK